MRDKIIDVLDQHLAYKTVEEMADAIMEIRDAEIIKLHEQVVLLTENVRVLSEALERVGELGDGACRWCCGTYYKTPHEHDCEIGAALVAVKATGQEGSDKC